MLKNPLYQDPSYLPAFPGSFQDGPALLKMTSVPKRRGLLRQDISRVIRRSSTAQTLKGMVTAGPIRSVCYLSHKLHKNRISKREKLSED
jgi:hypothetical protein